MVRALIFFAVLPLLVTALPTNPNRAISHGAFNLLNGLVRSNYMAVSSRTNSFEYCLKGELCNFPKICIDSDDVFNPRDCTSSQRKDCSCHYPEGPRMCTSSTDCHPGDRCLRVVSNGVQLCVSCTVSDDGVKNMPMDFSFVDYDVASCKGITDGKNSSTGTGNDVDSDAVQSMAPDIDNDSENNGGSGHEDQTDGHDVPYISQEPGTGDGTDTNVVPSISSYPVADGSSESDTIYPSPVPVFVSNKTQADGEEASPAVTPQPDDDENSPLTSPNPEPLPTGSYAGEPCKVDSDCLSPRLCYSSLTARCTSSSASCLCNHPIGTGGCSSSADCSYGERCMRVEQFQLSINSCLSCLVMENPDVREAIKGTKVDYNVPSCAGIVDNEKEPRQTVDPEENNGTQTGPFNLCIAVSSLASVDTSDLVYTTHMKAGVLCDEHENCATPGHIVVFRRVAMMMKSYCAMVGQCSKRVKYVNSVRMKAGIRIDSKHKDLRFTALAARYETDFEELVLRQVVGLGL